MYSISRRLIGFARFHVAARVEVVAVRPTSVAGVLSRPWWVGLGVVLATAIAILGIFLAAGGATSYSNTGPCSAQGNGNTVNCSGASSGTGS